MMDGFHFGHYFYRLLDPSHEAFDLTSLSNTIPPSSGELNSVVLRWQREGRLTHLGQLFWVTRWDGSEFPFYLLDYQYRRTRSLISFGTCERGRLWEGLKPHSKHILPLNTHSYNKGQWITNVWGFYCGGTKEHEGSSRAVSAVENVIQGESKPNASKRERKQGTMNGKECQRTHVL